MDAAEGLPEGHRLARALAETAATLPEGWSVIVGHLGQLRILPPKSGKRDANTWSPVYDVEQDFYEEDVKV
jgi:hypothetical protein